MSIDSWEKLKILDYIKKSTNTRLLGVLWRGSVWPVMKEYNRKHSFRDCIIYYWTHKEPSTKYSSGCPATSACFCWTFSQVSKFRVEFLQNGWKYPWFLLVSLVRPVQSLDVSGVWWGDPHHWVSCELYEFASRVNTSLIRLITLASKVPPAVGLRHVCMSTPSSGALDSGGYSPGPGRWPT